MPRDRRAARARRQRSERRRQERAAHVWRILVETDAGPRVATLQAPSAGAAIRALHEQLGPDGWASMRVVG